MSCYCFFTHRKKKSSGIKKSEQLKRKLYWAEEDKEKLPWPYDMNLILRLNKDETDKEMQEGIIGPGLRYEVKRPSSWKYKPKICSDEKFRNRCW